MHYSSYVLNEKAFDGYSCLYYVKYASEEKSINKFYGWDYYDTVEADDVTLNNEQYCAPCIPYIESFVIDEDIVKLTWSVEDLDKDIEYYKVFVSNVSRGWGCYYTVEDV